MNPLPPVVNAVLKSYAPPDKGVLAEPSTWASVAALTLATAPTLPEPLSYVLYAIGAIAGLLGVFLRERK